MKKSRPPVLMRASNLWNRHSMDEGMDDKATISVEDAFKELLEYVEKFDPIKLLSQLSLTHLSVPAGTYIDEDHNDIAKMRVYIEFLAGALLTREFPSDYDPEVTGQTLMRVKELCDSYYATLMRGRVSPDKSSADSGPDSILGSVRDYALWVRGEAYGHQYYDMARGIYGPHEAWFRSALGFTINEVIAAVEAISEEYKRRINAGRKTASKHAEELVNEHCLTGETKEQSKVQLACHLYFSRSDELLAFTPEELSVLSKLPRQVCIQILKRLSQEFGYRNPKFANTFCDPNAAPWDYNTLYERPFIRRGERYWMVLSPIIQTVVLTTFYFDLMQDASYRPTFEKARGRWLESKTAEYLRRVFDDEEVLLNPLYPGGNELSDVLVLHDQKLLIFQCKSKGLTFEARMGGNAQQLKSDLEKAVKDAFSQGVRARKYLLDTPQPVLRFKDRDHELQIDRSQVNGVFIINVTAAPLQNNLTTRWASVNPHLGLFTSGDYPWSLSLVDLNVLTEILTEPAHFLHFATRRLAIEHASREIIGDELDLLGFYLAQGLYFDLPEFEKNNSVTLAGMSHTIDEYMFKKHTLGDSVAKPSTPMPPGFEELITGISASGAAYRVDVAMALLDFGDKGRLSFVEQVDAAKERTREDHRPHNFPIRISQMKREKRGVSFLAMDAEGDQDLLFLSLKKLALWKKHQQQCSEWVGLGWDMSTDKVVDVVFYAAFEAQLESGRRSI